MGNAGNMGMKTDYNSGMNQMSGGAGGYGPPGGKQPSGNTGGYHPYRR